MMSIQVGIDLGTTNTVCCWIEDGKEKYVSFSGKDMLPSILMVNNGQILVGEMAKRRGIQYPEKLIRSSKTFMGDDTWSKTLEDQVFNATDAATEVLRHVRQELLASNKLAEDTEVEAVITIPAYFKAKQREATKEAGERAGFKVKGIIQEPIAAAIAATMDIDQEERIFVLDLGGGTFDVSILHHDPNNSGGYEIETVEGDAHLGGDNFDEHILEWLYSQIAMSTGINLRTDDCGIDKLPIVRGKLHKLAEELKIELSNKMEATAKIANLFTFNDSGDPYHLDITFTRDQFEEECARLFKKIERTIKRALADVDLDTEQIDRILLVGGSSQIPKIQEITQKIFGKDPFKNRDLSRIVAAGAALYATEQNGIVEMILPHSIGIEVVRDGVKGKMQIMLPRRAKYPIMKSRKFSTSVDFQDEITISVFEGENENTADNDFYGSLTLSGIEKAKAGVPEIMISFHFDRDGILHVQAKDLRTNVEMSEQVRLDKTTAVKKQGSAAANIALMIDTSGSMKRDNKMQKAKEAATNLVLNQLDLSQHHVAVIGFADSIKIAQNFTQNKSKLSEAIDNLTPAGGTHLSVTFNEMQKVFKNAGALGRCAILVTDGRTSNESAAIERAKQLKDQGIRLISIGVGKDVKSDYLLAISTSESDCYSIASMDELTDVFAEVSSTLQVIN